MKPKSYVSIVLLASTALGIGVSSTGCSNESTGITSNNRQFLEEIQISNDLSRETNKLLAQLLKNIEQYDQRANASLAQFKETTEQLAQLNKIITLVGQDITLSNTHSKETTEQLIEINKGIAQIEQAATASNTQAEQLIEISKSIDQVGQGITTSNAQAKETTQQLVKVYKSIGLIISQIDNTENSISIKEHLEDIKILLENLDK